MKYDCEVVRDLMPLVVDGAASEKSCALVDEHAAECENCREMLDEMRQEVPVRPTEEQGEKLVKKLRQRRRKRTAALVLLGVALSALLAAVGVRGWNYYFNDYCVLTAEENYDIELVKKGFNGVQMILTIRDGHQQSPHAVFDYDTGDMYLWSDTTRWPWPTQSEQHIMQLSDMFYFDDIGYAELVRTWDKETGEAYLDVMPIKRVFKGAPEGWNGDTAHTQMLRYEVIYPTSEELTEKWRTRLEAWGIELNPPPQTE